MSKIIKQSSKTFKKCSKKNEKFTKKMLAKFDAFTSLLFKVDKF